MKKNAIIAITVFFLQSCFNNGKYIDNLAETNEKRTDSFFPVTSFIKGQMIVLDSLPVTPLQITTINGKADSVWLTKKDIMPLLTSFLTPVINETGLTAFFKETKFSDQTLNAVTFTYDPMGKLPETIPLRHWDVYVNPQTGDVVKVYIVKNIKENGQLITQQLSWQTNKQAKISTILNKPDGNMELLKEVVFIWDFSAAH